MFKAAYETAGVGVSEKEVAAEVMHAMVMAGGEYPGFGALHPFDADPGPGAWNLE